MLVMLLVYVGVVHKFSVLCMPNALKVWCQSEMPLWCVCVRVLSFDGGSLTFPEVGHTTGWIGQFRFEKRTDREYIHKKMAAASPRLHSLEGARGGNSCVYLLPVAA